MCQKRTGKKIPLDVDTGEPHDCPENPYHGNNNNRLLECWTCGEQITFSDKMVSKKSGKKIPLDPKTMKPHNCPDPLSSENEEGEEDDEDKATTATTTTTTTATT